MPTLEPPQASLAGTLKKQDDGQRRAVGGAGRRANKGDGAGIVSTAILDAIVTGVGARGDGPTAIMPASGIRYHA